MLLNIAALANSTVEKIYWPDIKLQMPRINIRPSIKSLFKFVIVLISKKYLKFSFSVFFACGIFWFTVKDGHTIDVILMVYNTAIIK